MSDFRGREDYAGVMLEFQEWCERNHLSFRQELADLVNRRMGKPPTSLHPLRQGPQGKTSKRTGRSGTPVTLFNPATGARRRFNSQSEAARFLAVSKPLISQARLGNYSCRGYVVIAG